METTAGRRSGGWRRTLLVCAALLATAFAAAAILVVTSGDDAPGHAQPDVRLGEGTYAGRDWIYGYDVDAGQAPCFKLSIDGRATGCGTYRSRVDVMKRWTGSGNPEGFYTSQLLVTEEVAASAVWPAASLSASCACSRCRRVV